MESRRVRGRCCGSEPAAHGRVPVWIQTPRRLDYPECQRAWRGWSPSSRAREFSGSSGGVSARNVCAYADVRSAEGDEAETRNHHAPPHAAWARRHAAKRTPARAGRRTRRPPPARFRNAAHDHRRTDAPKAAANHASRSHQRPNAARTARAEGTVNDGSRRAARAGGGSQPAARRPQEASRRHAAVSGRHAACRQNAAARPTLRLCTSVRFGWRSPSRCHLTASSPQARRLDAFGEHDARHATNKGSRPKGFGK